MLFRVSSTGGLAENQTLLWFYNSVEKKSIHEISFCGTEKREEKTRQKLESEENHVHAQKPRLKLPFKNTISVETRLRSRDTDHTGKRTYRYSILSMFSNVAVTVVTKTGWLKNQRVQFIPPDE
jgi:hypothetical protein